MFGRGVRCPERSSYDVGQNQSRRTHAHKSVLPIQPFYSPFFGIERTKSQ